MRNTGVEEVVKDMYEDNETMVRCVKVTGWDCIRY